MDVRVELSYPEASIGQVTAMVLDEGFRTAVCDATGAVARDVDIRPQPDGSVEVRVSRTVLADVPDFIRTLVGRTLTIVQTEVWRPADAPGGRQAALSMQVVGQPATMTGTLTLEATTGGVLERIRGDLKVSIPFLGRRIESEVVKGIVAAAGKEEETGRSWLAR